MNRTRRRHREGVFTRCRRPIESKEAHMSANNLPTPIPIGSPHVVKPPLFDRWGLGRNRTDRRDYTRRQMTCDVWLLDLSGQSVLRCKTEDVSDAGLQATAPIGYGLAVGQRFEVRIANTEDAALVSDHFGASLGYGTVIRTAVKIVTPEQDRIGFAVRFDVPQLLPV